MDGELKDKARALIAETARAPRDWPSISALREALRPLRGAARRALEEAANDGASPAEKEMAALLLRDLFPPWPKE